MEGYECLLISCSDYGGSEEAALEYLKEGVDPNDPRYRDDTPLHRAVSSKLPGAVKRLIEYKANLNIKDKSNGWTALHWACCQESTESLKILLNEKDCDTALRDKEGKTPLDLAVEREYQEIVDYLKLKALSQACERGDLDYAQELFDKHQCDPTGALNEAGQTPLYIASSSGQVKILNYLVDVHKCDPNGTVDKEGHTPLAVASRYGQLEVVKRLIDVHWCDPQGTVDKEGHTPFAVASKYGQIEVMKCLADVYGYNPNGEVSKDGHTPLSIAAEFGQLKAVQYLINVQKCNPKGVNVVEAHTPLAKATQHKHKEVMQYLICALMNSSDEDIALPPQADLDNPTPLLLSFKRNPLLAELFPRIATRLILAAPKNVSEMKWEIQEDCFKRNSVSFYLDRVSQVTLVCHENCLEIHLFCNSKRISVPKLCDSVRSVIVRVSEELCNPEEVIIAFECPCDHKSSSDQRRKFSHLCELHKGSKFICDHREVSLDSLCLVWFGKEPTQILEHPQPLSVVEGTTVKMSVRAIGCDLTYQWMRENSPIVSSEMYSGEISPELKIKNTTPSVSGSYYCTVKGEVNSNLARLHVKRCASFSIDMTTEDLCAWLKKNKLPERDVCKVKDQYIDGATFVGLPLDKQTLKQELDLTFGGANKLFSLLKEAAGGTSSEIMEKTLGHLNMVELRRKLREALWEMRSEWYHLGIELNIPEGTLKAIKGNNPNDVDSCFTSLVTNWLEADAEIQWESLIEALKSPAVHRIDLIQNVEGVRSEAF